MHDKKRRNSFVFFSLNRIFAQNSKRYGNRYDRYMNMVVSISIIIPIYNVEPYVQRCLESVMAQDQAEADMECIVVDDCGSDHSMDVVHQSIAAYHGPIRFVVVEHEQNRGLSAARNTGLEAAKGDYVLFVDSDDYLFPDSISYFLTNLALHPEVDMLMGNVKNQKNGDMVIHRLTEPWLIDDRNVFFRRILHHQIYLYAWNKLIRRDVLMDNGIRFEDGILYEDQLWSYQLFSCLSSVMLLPRVTYSYEYNENSIVNTTFTPEKAEKTVWSYTVSINKMLDSPPVVGRFRHNMTVDYLLFMTNFMMNGMDVLSRCSISRETASGFLAVRNRLMKRALKSYRLLLSCFFLILYPPFTHLQKLRFFRHHYYNMESVVNHLCHWMDFLHK